MTGVSTLAKKRCRECDREILVSEWTPNPAEEYTTGMSAHRYDTELGQDRFVGWICDTCAFARVGEGKPGAISGPSLMFYY